MFDYYNTIISCLEDCVEMWGQGDVLCGIDQESLVLSLQGGKEKKLMLYMQALYDMNVFLILLWMSKAFSILAGSLL